MFYYVHSVINVLKLCLANHSRLTQYSICLSELEMNTTTSGDEEIDHTENTSMDLQLKAGSNSIDTGTIESSTSTSTVVAEQRSKVLTNQNTYLSASASHSLPWSWRKEHSAIFVSANGLDKSVRPGEFVLRALFAEFTSHVEKKTDAVLSPDAVEKPLSKVLQRGEDPAFDQLLTGKLHTWRNIIRCQKQLN